MSVNLNKEKQNYINSEYLHNILEYNPKTGVWIWKNPTNPNRICIGSEAGTINSTGYKIIKINNKLYMSSRLVWLYMTGEWPEGEIDHIDADTTNDKWNNLQCVSSKYNQELKARRGNVFGRKLTNNQILEIRSLEGKISQYKMADIFGVQQSQISRILNKKNYCWLKSDNKVQLISKDLFE